MEPTILQEFIWGFISRLAFAVAIAFALGGMIDYIIEEIKSIKTISGPPNLEEPTINTSRLAIRDDIRMVLRMSSDGDTIELHFPGDVLIESGYEEHVNTLLQRGVEIIAHSNEFYPPTDEG